MGTVICAWLLVSAGCIYVPGPPMTDTVWHRDLPGPPWLLGDSRSSSAIRPGKTREQVQSVLGEPHSASAAREAYSIGVYVGWVLGPFPFRDNAWNQTTLITKYWTLLVDYDQSGIVRRWQLVPGWVSVGDLPPRQGRNDDRGSEHAATLLRRREPHRDIQPVHWRCYCLSRYDRNSTNFSTGMIR